MASLLYSSLFCLHLQKMAADTRIEDLVYDLCMCVSMYEDSIPEFCAQLWLYEPLDVTNQA